MIQLHAITFADVALHLGIGGVFFCTSKCADRLCRHRLMRWAILAPIAIFEAVAITAVAG